MMNLNLRNAIIHNVTGNTQDQLQDTIVDAISNGEEKMLPGLGVLFEVIWQNSSNEEKQEMLHSIRIWIKKITAARAVIFSYYIIKLHFYGIFKRIMF